MADDHAGPKTFYYVCLQYPDDSYGPYQMSRFDNEDQATERVKDLARRFPEDAPYLVVIEGGETGVERWPGRATRT